MLFDCPKTPEARKEIDSYMEKNKPAEQPLSLGDPVTLRKEMSDYKLAMKGVSIV